MSILADDEPRPFEVLNAKAPGALLLICDHASNFVPHSLKGLGVTPAERERHIAWDIGAAEVTRLLAGRLNAGAVLSHFSRLVVDPNRSLDDPTLMPLISDHTAVPGNAVLGEAERQARMETFFHPYHHAIEGELTKRRARGQVPILVSMHSFTPVMDGTPRPWQIGILWNRDPRLPVAMIQRLSALGYTVGDNEPYSGRDHHGYTMHRHANPAGIPHVLIELRQDLIDTHHGAKDWADKLAPLLDELCGLPEMREVKVY